MRGWHWIFLFFALLYTAGPLLAWATLDLDFETNWRATNRESVGIAPDPAKTPEAVLQVYAARAFSWRGIFGVHSWIAIKPPEAGAFTVYQVIGWHRFFDKPVLFVKKDLPDRRWYGQAPEILLDLRGKPAEVVLEKVKAAIAAYPYSDDYRMWPGPNSNTFTAYVGRAVPELGLRLPPTAIGKDYLGNSAFLAAAPSGTGYQFSLFGMVGVLFAEGEGFEMNLLGLSAGFDPFHPALLLPGMGRIALAGVQVQAKNE